ncbi:hypothetical protein K435DRAFT_838643 [Dendrothele bispora CBS 962.96]|uniref:F-box domain-containing protein n=1 Tax=Dendrothele bispora (strain CBS 962.96) TaxID=1314807 RepID=A0A4S8M5B8_DENBC|nr:hypothetical protein K435DRAFT_838643 [Dendrothele bispora CBS 962.96]
MDGRTWTHVTLDAPGRTWTLDAPWTHHMDAKIWVPRLKRLEVRGCVLGEGDLMDILKRTPSLERLTFYECQEEPTGIGGEDAEEEEMVQGRSHSGEVVPLIATTKSLLISLASRDVPRLLPSLWMLNITIPTLAIPDYLFPVIETRWIPSESSQSHVATMSDSRSACLGTVTVQVPMRGDRMSIDDDNGSDIGMEIRRRLRDRLDGVLRGGFRLRVDDLKPGT